MVGDIDVQPDSRLSVPGHVLSRKAAGETVLLSLETEDYYGLDGVGSRLWDLLEAGTTYGRAVTILAEEYAVVPAVLDADLQAFLRQLAEEGLVLVDAA